MPSALKRSEFNLFTPSHFPGTVIGYNAFTGAYITVSDDEFRSIEKRLLGRHRYGGAPDRLTARLKALGFLVDAEFDERARMRDLYAESKARPTGLSLTLAPTVSCNFACTYCFEEHPKRHMGEDDIAAIRAYVDANLPSGEYLAVTWFGGEPLAKFATISTLNEYFHDVCTRRDAEFTQSIITNGSLLNEDRIRYFNEQGNLQYAQITLDGPEDIHDQRRPTALGKGTFGRIMDTLRRVGGRLNIALRVNIDRNNVTRVSELIDQIAGEPFARSVALYFGHVVSYTDACSEETADDSLSVEEFADCEAKLFFRMFQSGMRPAVSIPAPSRGNMCVADHGRGAVIAPGGLKFGCWNETALPADQASGQLGGSDIKVGEKHRAKHDEWAGYNPFAHPLCDSCAVQPLCRGGCPWEARKHPVDSTGHCSPLRFNLAERLRLYHLVTSVDASASVPVQTLGPCP